MSASNTCTNCGHEIEHDGFGSIGGYVRCPECNAEFVVEYEETWDGEEEYGWFYLTRSAQ